MSRVQEYITAALILAAFSCGLFFTGQRDVMYAPALLCLIAASLIAVLPGLHAGQNIISLPSRTPPAFLFLFWVYATLSLSWSLVPFVSLVTWLIVSSLPLIFFALTCSSDRTRLIRISANILSAATCVLALWAVVQAVSGNIPRAQGPMSDPNNLAALFNLSLMPALAFLLTRPRTDKAFTPMAVMAVILFAGLISTQSRGGILSLALAAPVLTIMLRVERKRLLALLASGIALIALFHFAVSDAFIPRILHLIQPLSDGPASSRLALWGSAWQMLLDNPMAGTGLGTFYLFYPAYRQPLTDDSGGNFAHMDPLQFGVEMGAVAMILFYALVVSMFVRTNRALDQGRSPQDNMQMSGAFAGILAVIVQAHVNFPLYALPILIALGVWMAKWYDDSAHLTEKPSYVPAEFTKPWQAHATGACVTVTALLLLLMAGSSAAGQIYVTRAIDATGRNDIESFITNISKAQKFAPASFIDPQVQTAGLYIDMMNMPPPLLAPADRDQMIADSIQLLAQAEHMNPGWAEINYKRGKLYSLLRPGDTHGNKLMADEEWRIALRKNPQHYKARLLLAASMMQKGRAIDAYEILSSGLTYPLPAAAIEQIRAALAQVREPALIQQREIANMNKPEETPRKKKTEKSKKK